LQLNQSEILVCEKQSPCRKLKYSENPASSFPFRVKTRKSFTLIRARLGKSFPTLHHNEEKRNLVFRPSIRAGRFHQNEFRLICICTTDTFAASLHKPYEINRATPHRIFVKDTLNE
jgi:hypothetical protein